MIMEEESNAMDGHGSETEDMPVSDPEDAMPADEDIPLHIDSNARVASKDKQCDTDAGDNCDMYYVDKNYTKRRGSEHRFHTSTEDLDISDEEPCNSTLQTVNLDTLVGTSTKEDLNSLSTLNYSHTGYKDEFAAEAEYLPDEDIGNSMEKRYFSSDVHKSLPPGVKFAGINSTAEANTSINSHATQKALYTLNIKNAFTKSLFIEENDINNLYDEQETPLMTCLEFLKSEATDDYDTDAEDLSIGSLDDPTKTYKECKICEGGCNETHFPISIDALSSEKVEESGILYPGDRRRSSAAVLTEDETFNLENFSNVSRKRVKKRSFLIFDEHESSDDSPTDEEDLEGVNKEWTETDDSGGVRQITQIKTETSIKLEGEGDDLGTGGDDIISRTTTTTTRIVTTVTTDGEQESHEDQNILSDGDDLRHSVEVILNQFMSSDSDATKPEDSMTEHDE